MTRLSLCCALLIAPLIPLVALGQDLLKARETVLAVVDDEAITSADVDQRIKDLKARLDEKTREKAFSGPPAQIRADTLESLIHDKLLLAEARLLINRHELLKKKFEELVHARIDRERRKAGGDIAFKDKLEKQGITYKRHIKNIRKQLMRTIILNQFVDRNLSVSPQELRASYEENLQRFQVPPRVKYRQIFVRVDAYQSRAQAWQTVQLVMERIRKQHDFAKLVPLYSDGPRAANGGLWESTRKGLRPKQIDKTIFSLPIGETSDPIETKAGFTIVKVESRRKARTRPLDEVQEILKRELLEKKRARRYNALINRLEEKHYVKRMP